MGADLWIESISQRKQAMYRGKFEEAVKMRDSLKPPYNQEYQEMVEFYFDKLTSVGYYRDSYNNSNLLWRFEFSYWNNDLQLDDDGNLPPSQARRLLAFLKEREPIFEESLQRISEDGWSDSPEEVIRYFRMKYLRLRVFLKMAIKLDEPIVWSV
jgi:hypothetical protein